MEDTSKQDEKKNVGGRPKKIATPELLWSYFQLYKTEVKANPLFKAEQRKGNIIISKDFEGDVDEIPSTVNLPLERPLTMIGFELWLFNNNIISDISDYMENKDSRYAKYVPICRAIKGTIKDDQISGGMAGIYNPSITQRLNNLKESIEQTNVEQPLFPSNK